MTWTKLPPGEDVSFTQGKSYALVASVSSSTTRAKIDSALAKYFPGVTITSYFEQGESGGPPSDPDTSRKQVAAVVLDRSFTGTLSWSKGIPIVAPDIYTLTGAWVWTGASENVTAEGQPWAGALPIRRPPSPLGWVAFWIVAVGGGALAVYHYRDPIRKALARAGP